MQDRSPGLGCRGQDECRDGRAPLDRAWNRERSTLITSTRSSASARGPRRSSRRWGSGPSLAPSGDGAGAPGLLRHRATPLAFWWLDTATVYALGLVVIASVYIGFAVADGRRTVLAVESGVAGMFVIIAAAAITGTPWLLVVGLAGLKDLWQHRRQFVANTRWWPPFCLVVEGGRRNHRRRDRRRRSLSPLEAWSGVPASHLLGESLSRQGGELRCPGSSCGRTRRWDSRP
jgi:hypothetical protein